MCFVNTVVRLLYALVARESAKGIALARDEHTDGRATFGQPQRFDILTFEHASHAMHGPAFLAGQLDRRGGLLQDTRGGGYRGEVHCARLGRAGRFQHGPQVP